MRPMLDIYLTVIKVIQRKMGVVRVIYHQGTTHTITVLGLEVAVIPKCSLRYSN